jgi:hypothetical protein
MLLPAADIQRVAQKYFNYNNTRVIVVGKAETVKPGLAKLGYEVKAFDKYAKPVTAKAAAAVNLSADEIIGKYITAVGGADELNKVNSIVYTGTMSMQGATMNVTEKKMMPNLDMMNIEMNGQSVMHQAFNGETGYQMQMGNKQDLSEDELTEYKENKGIVPQLFYKQNGFKLEVTGVEKVGDKDAYKVKVTSPSGKTSTEYYDVATSYLLREEKTINAGGQELTQTIDNNNYSKEGNIVLPHSVTISVQAPQGNQDFTIEIKEVKFNEGVTADDFN